MKDEEPIGLALSGGGFRATLFHLGIIRFLYEKGALSRVNNIASVSGGSVLAAHLVLHWERYTGTEEDFDKAAAEIIEFIRSDVRGRILRRWCLSWVVLWPLILFMLSRQPPFAWSRRFHSWKEKYRFTRTQLLEGYYARLFSRQSLGALRPIGPLGRDRPELYVLATSLTTGDLCSFSSQGVLIDELPTPRLIRVSELPIACAVAASSAFPPLFPPVEVSYETLRCSEREFPTNHYLADGGIFDNLGVLRLLSLDSDAFKVLVVSEAQGALEWDRGSDFNFLPARAVRSTNLLMERVADLQIRAMTHHAIEGQKPVRIRLHSVLDRAGESEAATPEVQRDLQRVRTDLDQFSCREIHLLVRQGYLAAKAAWSGGPSRIDGDIATKSDLWSPIKLEDREKGADIRESRRQRWRLFNSADWASWALVMAIAAWVGGGLLGPTLYFGVRARVEAEKATLAESVSAAAQSPGGDWLLYSDPEGKAYIVDARTRQHRWRVGEHVTAAAFSPDARIVVVAQRNKLLVFWEISSVQSVRKGEELSTGTSSVLKLAFSPDSKIVAAGQQDGEIRLWRMGPKPELLAVLKGNSVAVTGMSFSPDGLHLLVSTTAGTTRSWNLETHGFDS